MALVQIIDEIERLEKTYEGYNGISLTNFTSTLEPEIANGSVIEIGGSIFEASGGDEAIAGWAAIGVSNDVYIYVSALGVATFLTTVPTWDTVKQGYYNGTDRAVAGLYKVDAVTYANKFIIEGYANNQLFYRSTDTSTAMAAATWTKQSIGLYNYNSIIGLTVAGDVIACPAGKYVVDFHIMGWTNVNADTTFTFISRLRDTTNNINLAEGNFHMNRNAAAAPYTFYPKTSAHGLFVAATAINIELQGNSSGQCFANPFSGPAVAIRMQRIG